MQGSLVCILLVHLGVALMALAALRNTSDRLVSLSQNVAGISCGAEICNTFLLAT